MPFRVFRAADPVPELNDHALFQEVVGRQPERAEAEFIERGHEPVRVLFVDPDPDVKILCEPGMARSGVHRTATNSASATSGASASK